MKKILRRIGIGLGVLLTIFLIVFAIFVVLSQPMPEHPFFTRLADLPKPLVLAHQGGDGERPSNTMVAFQYAHDLGVDMLELDVHTTKDGVLVVIHDATIDRTTDGTGRVQDYTFEELQAFDAGYDWPTLEDQTDVTERPYRGQGITIPSLEELFQTFPDDPMSIEIKQDDPSIAQVLCDLIRTYDRADRTIVPSFRASAMLEFRQVCPEVPTAGVEDEVRTYFVLNTLFLGAAWQPATHSFMVPEYSGDLHVLTPSFVANLRQHNVAVYPWTINDEETMRRMIDLGVDGIITDYPARLMSILGRS